MQEGIEMTDRFLAFNEREVLTNAGKVSRKYAEKHALGQYKAFNDARRQ